VSVLVNPAEGSYVDDKNAFLMNRRHLLNAALLGAGGAVIAGCGSEDADVPEEELWAGFDEHITERTLAEAEKLFGLNFTDAERKQMFSAGFGTRAGDVINDRVKMLQELRGIDIPNSLAPSLVFDPRLPGMAYPRQGNVVSLYQENIAARPGDDESVAFATIKQQARWIANGEITSRELTDIYLDRIERLGERLECFVTVTPKMARAQADQADRERRAGRVRGPLHGIPYAAKDLLDTNGVRTTWGAMPYRDRVAESNSAVIRKLYQAGAVLLGKTTLGAIAYGDVWFGGVTRNPWNTEEGSSGSSAGSASATAAGLCAFSIGTETLGSIVSPSDRCGTTGLRPTFGRVSRVGAMALCWSLDKIGPICRSVEDTALVLSAINGFDVEDAGSIDVGFSYMGGRPVNELTVGYDPAWFEGEDLRSTDVEALNALNRLGTNVTELQLPDMLVDAIMPALMVEAAAAFEDLTLSNRDDEMRWQVDRAWPNGWRQSRFISAVDYVQGDRLRRKFMHEMHDFFSQVDVVFGPSFGSPMLRITNFTGQPCIVMRAGFEEIKSRPRFDGPAEDEIPDTTHRVPRSVCLWSGLFDEANIVTVARALETELGVAGERPTLS
jgi:Asp-tRNA(Asn)/Glu-tRNA(Gln) amidotransferase A subunit family amidase